MEKNSSYRRKSVSLRRLGGNLGVILAVILLFQTNPFSRGYTPAGNQEQVFAAPMAGTTRRRVILMIGDGMGANQRLAGQWSKVGLIGSLAMDSLPVHGVIHTINVDGGITDSAAAATAMATGVKTKNSYLGVDRNGVNLKSILDYAQERGMMTGLVLTSQITNATPAAFASHITDRYLVLEIASQMLAYNVDILLGGGEGDWIPDAYSGCYGAGNRDDDHNLILDAVGYEYVCTPTAFASLTPGFHQLIGFFAHEKMLRTYSPTLAAMTDTALNRLATDPEGFFLLVEGSQIDNAASTYDGANMIDDVKTFDDAVQVAVDFSNTNPDTMLIVVADHETGDLSLTESPSNCDSGEGPFQIFGSVETFCTDFKTNGHTGTPVPLTAMGPDSGYLSGTHENTEIFITMFRYLHSFYFAYLPALLRQ